MDDKKFLELLKLVAKEKKPEEEETKILCGAELRERFGKALLSSIKSEVNRDGE